MRDHVTADHVSSEVDVVTLTDDTWPLFEELFGPGGLQGGCWCAYFRMPAREFSRCSPGQRKDRTRQAVREGYPFGLLALVDGAPHGWVAVSPREHNPRLAGSMVARLAPDDNSVGTWSVTCFYTHRHARRRGLTRTLLEGAVTYAAEHGATTVEGYPVDTAGARLIAGDRYHGELSTFLDAGFALVDRRGTRRALVRKSL